MTRVYTVLPTLKQLEDLEQNVTPETEWLGTKFGINLIDLLEYARDGLKIRDENLAYADEMERDTLKEAWNHSKECVCDVCANAKALLPAEEYDPWEENSYALQLEGRAYGPNNPELRRVPEQY